MAKRISASPATICEPVFPLTAILVEFFARNKRMDLFQWIDFLLLVTAMVNVTRVVRKDNELCPGI
jgi:hypothetical protein